MLTAVVCGEVFASPSVQNILSAILTVAPPGESSQILLIVKNYTGDRLNFGLAAEIAKSKYGYRVEIVLVDDDCAIENYRKAVGRRGLAGTILIHKIAGAMAEMGADLTTIHTFCYELLRDRNLATVGFTYHDAGSEGLKNIEIGRGIHGEPGILSIENEPNFEQIVEICLQKLYKQIPRKDDQVSKPQVVLLLNNLGGASAFSMCLFSNLLLKQMKIEYDIRMILEGCFMSSFNQEGISVTILNLEKTQEKGILTFLRSPVRIAANVPFNNLRSLDEPEDHPVARYDTEQNLSAFVYDERCYLIKYEDCGVEATKKALLSITGILLKCEKSLNEMDNEFGDGDTGTLICCAANGIQSALLSDKINFMYPCVTIHELSEVIQKHMGGSLGAILAIFLQGLAESFTDESAKYIHDNRDLMNIWLNGLNTGLKAVVKYGKADVGDRTMIDALIPGIEALEKSMLLGAKIAECIDDFATGCEAGADQTKMMLPKSGRAAYAFSEEGKEFNPKGNDPGAMVIGIVARAVYEGVKSVLARHGVE